HLHEMPDQIGTLRTIAKHAELIAHPALAPDSVARAFQVMRSGRPGPAVLAMPWDIFTTKAPVGDPPPLPVPPAPQPNPIDIDPAEMRRARPTLPILADSAEAAAALLRAITSGRTDQADRIAAGKAWAAREIQRVQPQLGYLEAIRDVLPADGFLVDEMVQ